jgi:hypothetical protein
MTTIKLKSYGSGTLRLCEEILTDGSKVYNVFYGIRAWYPGDYKEADELYESMKSLLDKSESHE